MKNLHSNFIFIVAITCLLSGCSTTGKTVSDTEKPVTQNIPEPNTTTINQKISNTNDSKISESSNNKEDPNIFNRLLKQKHLINKSMTLDSNYDKNNPALSILQKPSAAFASLPTAKSGNGVDWVQAIESGKIKPRNTVDDPDIEPLVMDLNIIREVKGSMPDVAFPHKPHTQVLDCTNCHPGIFIPQKGANNMSMAKNLMGEMCGVCHGKVAFPLSRCTSCHSIKKNSQKKSNSGEWKWP